MEHQAREMPVVSVALGEVPVSQEQEVAAAVEAVVLQQQALRALRVNLGRQRQVETEAVVLRPHTVGPRFHMQVEVGVVVDTHRTTATLAQAGQEG